jgi:outer membrane protein OmpA-like peptidoglycan-associated protein
MKTHLIACCLVLASLLTACGNSTTTNNDATESASEAQTTADSKDTLGRPQAYGWSEVQPYDLPIIRSQMEEVDSNDVTMRGNEQFTAYELSEEVLFDAGKAALKPNAAAKLKQVSASIAKRYPQSEVRIFGYTDSRESKAESRELSEKRAEAVKEWMVKNGNVDAARISVHPRGENNPVASNATPEGRKENRRVEIVVKNQ